MGEFDKDHDGSDLDCVDLTLTEDWSLTDRVHWLLKRTIIDGKIPLGTRLVEKDLANRLKVSRSPLREAIQRLQFDGLVRIVPRKESYVVEFSEKELLDIFQVRENLEGLAVQLAAVRITNEQLDAIERELVHVQEILSDDEASYPMESNRDFHDVILEASGNKRLADIMRMLQSPFQLLRRLSAAVPGRARSALNEYFGIFEALRARDGELVRKRTCEHIQNALASTIQVIEREGEDRIDKKAS